MLLWKQKAIDILPQCKADFEEPDTSVYDVFFELIEQTIEAHRRSDTEKLKKYYDFAEWCFRQNDKELWNAAAVAFYEHLGDYDETFADMPRWVKPDIYRQVRGLLDMRLSDDKLAVLDCEYGLHQSGVSNSA